MLDKKISRCDEVIVNLQMMIQTTLPLSVSVPTGPPESTAVPEPPGAPKPAYGEQKPASGEPEHAYGNQSAPPSAQPSTHRPLSPASLPEMMDNKCVGSFIRSFILLLTCIKMKSSVLHIVHDTFADPQTVTREQGVDDDVRIRVTF